MYCEGKLKLRSHNRSYCLIDVITKAGLTVIGIILIFHIAWCKKKVYLKLKKNDNDNIAIMIYEKIIMCDFNKM